MTFDDSHGMDRADKAQHDTTQPDMVQADAEDSPLLHYRPFLLFWLARVFSIVGFQVSAVAVGWQVYELTGSAFNLGMVGLVQFLPMVVLTLAAGHVADRYDRRFITRTCQFIECVAASALALGSLEGGLHIAGIFAAVALIGAARSFENPTMAALLPGLVTPRQLPKAAAVMSSAVQTAFIIGPALGGLLYAAGAIVPYAVAASLFLLAGIFSGSMRLNRPTNYSKATGFRSVFLGITFIRTHPAVLGAISLDLFAVLLGGATALLPIFARDILHTGPWGLGMLRSAPAAGALVMSLILARHPLNRRVGRIMFGAVIIFGMATIVFAVSTSLALSIAALMTLGAADVFSVVIRMTLVQLSTPDEMRGRVSAVNALFIGTSNQLGEFESGVTAAIFGLIPAVLIGGIGTIAVALIWMYLFPELRNTDSLGSTQV
jgi:MFS family permease